MPNQISQSGEKIRILVVDDSPVARRVLVNFINQETDMTVVGEAVSGNEAIQLIHPLHPQVVSMDLYMPGMGGVEAIEVIMGERPVPIVAVCDSKHLEETQTAFQALTAGALKVCEKPRSEDDKDIAASLIKTLRAMAKVSVVRHRKSDGERKFKTGTLKPLVVQNRPEIVFIVSSTGGPHALERIFKRLPADFPLPIVVVQHMEYAFVDNMVHWLDTLTSLKVEPARLGEEPRPGHIYIAPGGQHLRMAFNKRFALDKDTEGYRHVPSGDVLLESAAEVMGGNAIGVILTGMGEDGTEGLLKMREKGAHTIAQDEASSVVFGMPDAAIKKGGTEFVVALEDIAGMLVSLCMEE